MNEYVFLYRGGSRPTSPEEGQQIMQKWFAWFKDLGAKGQVANSGQPLEPAGKVIEGTAKSITDGPYAEAKDLVGGYSVIKAKDLAEAAEIAKGCPILERGGKVEVRPVMQIDM